jgi:hypothetical protein
MGLVLLDAFGAGKVEPSSALRTSEMHVEGLYVSSGREGRGEARFADMQERMGYGMEKRHVGDAWCSLRTFMKDSVCRPNSMRRHFLPTYVRT